MIRKIVGTKDPRLRAISKTVKKVDKKVLALIKDLKDTLVVQKDPEGVGLAACQIGKNIRVFVMKDKDKIRAIINPQIIKVTRNKTKNSMPKKDEEIMEGCLSLPDYYSPIRRGEQVEIKYLNEKGEEKTEKFSGFTAQIVQHEIDHLEGIMFIDRLLEQKKSLYKLEKGDWERVELI